MAKEKIEVDVLPLNYPKLLSKKIADLTGRRTFRIQNLKKKINGIDIWMALRMVYSHFVFYQPGFSYQENFSWPENYSTYETYEVLEHLRLMLKKFLNLLSEENNDLTWEHLAECNYHFDIFQGLIFSFIEAVEEREFGNRFNERLVKIVKKYTDRLLKELEELELFGERD